MRVDQWGQGGQFTKVSGVATSAGAGAASKSYGGRINIISDILFTGELTVNFSGRGRGRDTEQGSEQGGESNGELHPGDSSFDWGVRVLWYLQQNAAFYMLLDPAGLRYLRFVGAGEETQDEMQTGLSNMPTFCRLQDRRSLNYKEAWPYGATCPGA